jgi:hypothetical protein
MASRLELHNELLKFLPKVYFQPPSNITMTYPCIIYSKSGKNQTLANDGIYLSKQGYQIMVIDKNPDSIVADNIESRFQYCTVNQYYTVDNLYHTTLTLYY